MGLEDSVVWMVPLHYLVYYGLGVVEDRIELGVGIKR